MAVEDRDPSSDSRARYDYQGGVEEASPELQELVGIARGEVRFDALTRELYSTDASIYQVTPLGVVFPEDTPDVAAIVSHCAEHDIPLLPRGAGTSLAGQTVNEAVVLDFSRHMASVTEIMPGDQRCVAEPGIVLATLNDSLEPHGLKFAPDPAWGDKSTLGGAVGNNSTGSHSLAYGKTDEYIESCEVVLADGTITTFGWCDPETVTSMADPDGNLEARIYHVVDRILTEESETIADEFPSIHRNVSGYNLDRLIADSRDGQINIARLLAGSEGTLAIVTSIEISLEPVPPEKGVALLLYENVRDATADVKAIVDHGPAAVELVDDVLIDLARNTEEFGPVVSQLPAQTGAVLLVEFYGDSTDEISDEIDRLVADRLHETSSSPPRAFESRIAQSADEQAQFWKLRKSGLPILLSRTGDEKHIAFIEDTAVPVQSLADYVADVEDVLDAHDTFASFYAHAGPGCLHIRPLINTKTSAGEQTMESIAEEVTDLVIAYGGSISGEHGDGRARTQWNRRQYGEAVFSLFQELKKTFDPDGLLNPGQVCGDISMRDHLRFGADYRHAPSVEPQLVWDNENGFQGMVELCHGCGGCRGQQQTTGGTMCPTFRASEEEITSTRGRANLLRQAMNGDLPEDMLTDPHFMQEVLDLCIGCKGCARDCPSEVDMAKLKAELTAAYQREHGVDRRTKLFANIHQIGKLGSATAPVSNWMQRVPGSGWLMEQLIGIARERSPPHFHRSTFLDEMNNHPGDSNADVIVLPDTVTNFHEPAIAMTAVEILRDVGLSVTVPSSFLPVGRAAYSKGRLELATERAGAVIETVEPIINAGGAVLTLEPSDAVMLQSDYRHLLGQSTAELIANNSYGFAEYLLESDVTLPSIGAGTTVTYHGHCHQKATGRAVATKALLETVGYDVEMIDSGCCGMAGSFGYEAEHYSMSMAIGNILNEQLDAQDCDIIVAPGASCRTQIAHLRGTTPYHPVELLDERPS